MFVDFGSSIFIIYFFLIQAHYVMLLIDLLEVIFRPSKVSFVQSFLLEISPGFSDVGLDEVAEVTLHEIGRQKVQPVQLLQSLVGFAAVGGSAAFEATRGALASD